MPAIPLPFVIALLLILLAAQLPRERGKSARLAVAFLSFCALLVACVGLRWHYQWPAMAMVQPMLAVLLPSLLWLCFTRTIGYAASGRLLSWLPVGLVPVLMFGPVGWRQGLDVLISLSYLGHAALLFRLSRRSSDDFSQVMFSQCHGVPRLCLGAGLFLLFSVVTDVAIALDAWLGQGQSLIRILTISQCLVVTGLSYAVITVSRIAGGAELPATQVPALTPDLTPARASTPTTVPDTQATVSASMPVTAPVSAPGSGSADSSDDVVHQAEEQDARAMEALTTLLHEQALYLDPNLTLTVLARKTGIPARQLSAAVNRQTGLNVSQLINQYRIEKARQLLKETDFSITEIYGMAGFNTKSNFNREFSRLTAMTPSAYRRSAD
ncbi:helix-turn-helix domain-containing protein [Photobacterium sp. TY1-4]|uniref:helix-turn-helix domain-containing protein n=1 Tax=Photobacterium sp. TY1-4 TaxID=2899122 RepID=UPI0021C23894|nr:AraC family transcriptional regulator [Photobacterium sp. TY1-4]UXI00979.1 AraC family transcriptional regulator [Photobacterium sp. TY1-4]